VPFDTNNTVQPFLCYEYPYTVQSLLASHPEQLISVAFSSIELATTTFPLCFLNARHVNFLSDDTSTTSPALPVSELTFQVPTRNPSLSTVHQPLDHHYHNPVPYHRAVLCSGWVSPPLVCIGMWGHPRVIPKCRIFVCINESVMTFLEWPKQLKLLQGSLYSDEEHDGKCHKMS